jgi:hypothetical protein
MTLLDIVFLCLWLAAWVGAFLRWSDSLYKLFLWLIIWFLTYLVISYQVEITSYSSPALLDWYQSFLSKHSVWVLSMALLTIPLLGLIFMFHPRLIIETKPKSISQLVLWLLLPIFLIGILSLLESSSILSDSQAWGKVFDFFSGSWLYGIFQELPWGIFLLLWFLIFYKSILLLLAAFIMWLWRDVISHYFRDWKKRHRKALLLEELENEE